MRRSRILISAVLGALVAPACGDPIPGQVTASLWPAADALFLDDPRWVGGDGAFSVDLGGGRVLWLFGDSFVALSAERTRERAVMVRNSVAIQTGYDPSRALIAFRWAVRDGDIGSFIPEEQEAWFWPNHGIRIDDRLLLFYERVVQPAGTEPGPWSFEGAGWKAVVVDNPDEDPLDGRIAEAQLPAEDFGVGLGEAVWEEGDWVYAIGERGDAHEPILARWPRERAWAGDLRAPQWWSGDAGWRAAAEANPEALFAIGAPECSVQWSPKLGRYLWVATQGFGPGVLMARVARQAEGPWSAPQDLIRPPESFRELVDVYAGKAHPALQGADLVATYVPGDSESLAPEARRPLYHPRFVRLSFHR